MGSGINLQKVALILFHQEPQWRLGGILVDITTFNPLNPEVIRLRSDFSESTRVTIYIYHPKESGVKHSCLIRLFRKGDKVAFCEMSLVMSPLEISVVHGIDKPIYLLESSMEYKLHR